jgi:hypothetical protein
MMGTETDLVASGLAASGDNQNSSDGGNQSGVNEWAKGLDPALAKRVEKFKTPADLVKAYAEIESTAFKSFQDMTPQEQEKFLKRLGLPESPEGYELSTVTLPEALASGKQSYDAEYRSLAKEMNLTKAQGKKLHEWLMSKAVSGYSAQQSAVQRSLEEGTNSLRQSWGASYDGNNSVVDKVIRLGGDKFVERMNAGAGKDPVIRAGLLEIAKKFQIQEDTLVEGRVDRPAPASESRSGFLFDPSKVPELTGANRSLR